MKTSRISSKGQITIPKEIRKSLDIEPGDIISLTKLKTGPSSSGVLPRLMWSFMRRFPAHWMSGPLLKMRMHFVTCERWDVVVLPFPFTEKQERKRRPAVVISKQEFNRSGHTLLAMITSRAHNPWPGDIGIVDLDAAGLMLRVLSV